MPASVRKKEGLESRAKQCCFGAGSIAIQDKDGQLGAKCLTCAAQVMMSSAHGSACTCGLCSASQLQRAKDDVFAPLIHSQFL